MTSPRCNVKQVHALLVLNLRLLRTGGLEAAVIDHL
jgi:hypothetical protein